MSDGQGNASGDMLIGESSGKGKTAVHSDGALYAGAGDDEIRGSAGEDWLYGDAGEDLFIWDTCDGNDFMDGGTGWDSIALGKADGETATGDHG